jgi:hypothetical protein
MTAARVPGPIGGSGATALPLSTGPGQRGSQPGPIGRQYVFADANGSGGPMSASKKVDAVANLKKPADAIVQKLSDAIKSVMKEKNKDEALRQKKEKVLKDIVDAYGVGQKFVSSLQYDDSAPEDLADTRETDVIAYDGCLKYPGFCASVMLHESAHAQRNAELKSAGIDSNSLGFMDSDIWKALKEVEGPQLEIDSAATTGITAGDKNFATSLRDRWLNEIETLMGPHTRTAIENGGLDDVRDKFIKKLQKKKHGAGVIPWPPAQYSWPW